MSLLGTETGPHVFVDDLAAPVLGEDDRHHLARVLRVRDGDALTVCDGRGSWRTCRFGPTVEVVGDVVNVSAPTRELTIGFALVKGERPELVVQKLTELGIDRIVPFVASRSVVRWDAARAEKQLARLRRVAREAAMQSRRCWLPVVQDLQPFAKLVAEPGIALAEQGGGPPTLEMSGALVGPEGGWTPEELALARLGTVPSVSFATNVLRAETAAYTAAAVLGALRLGLVHPRGGESC